MEKQQPGLCFVVLRHEGIPDPHFDVLFETAPGSALAAWRSPVWPMDQGADLVRLPDHRREYLAYEGPVSGNRGQVRRVAAGECWVQQEEQPPGSRMHWLISLELPDWPQRRLTLREGSEGGWRGTTHLQ